ncbi:MAG: hypothetical protein ACYSRP_00875 [Planctomycetota bacterium]|jgi:hypothetical protein
MAKGGKGKAFFEVYGSQPPKGKESGAGKSGKEKNPPDFPSSVGEEFIVISDIGDGLHEPKERPPGKGRRGIILPAIIIGSVCGIGLAVGMFFLGRSLGTAEPPSKAVASSGGPERPGDALRDTTKETIKDTKTKPAASDERSAQRRAEAAATAKSLEKRVAESATPPAVAPPAPAAVPPAESADTWALRIISYSDVQKNLEKAAAVADFLQSTTGQDAFVARLGDKLVVCLGEFHAKNDPELVKLQRQVRGFEYENKKQFLSSYPVRLR